MAQIPYQGLVGAGFGSALGAWTSDSTSSVANYGYQTIQAFYNNAYNQIACADPTPPKRHSRFIDELRDEIKAWHGELN